ncbi:MAG: hypothetical protein KAI47_08410, partial [Deltaproteobacteria bacterium]|nr:hypothetical protein [Deltaproteobacteria bacterium]
MNRATQKICPGAFCDGKIFVASQGTQAIQHAIIRAPVPDSKTSKVEVNLLETETITNRTLQESS